MRIYVHYDLHFDCRCVDSLFTVTHNYTRCLHDRPEIGGFTLHLAFKQDNFSARLRAHKGGSRSSFFFLFFTRSSCDPIATRRRGNQKWHDFFVVAFSRVNDSFSWGLTSLWWMDTVSTMIVLRKTALHNDVMPRIRFFSVFYNLGSFSRKIQRPFQQGTD